MVWAIAILLAFVGVALIAYSAWKPIRAWRRRGKACVLCGYPRAVNAGIATCCPECGTECDRIPPWSNMVLPGIVTLARVAIAIGSFAPLAMLMWPHRTSRVLEPVFVSYHERSRVDLNAGTFIHEERAYRTPAWKHAADRLKAFRIVVGYDVGFERARITDRNGNVVHRVEGWGILTGSPLAPGERGGRLLHNLGPFIPNRDIDGDQIPDIIVANTSVVGGNWEFAVVSFSDPPRVVAAFSAPSSASFRMRPTVSGNTTFIEVPETTWHRHFKADTGVPSWRQIAYEPIVTMRLKQGRLEIMASAMQRTAPSAGVLAAKATEVQGKLRRSARAQGLQNIRLDAYWGGALELMYSGHEDLGWKFLQDAWPADLEGKDAVMAEFREILQSSPYWEGIRAAFAAEREWLSEPLEQPAR